MIDLDFVPFLNLVVARSLVGTLLHFRAFFGRPRYPLDRMRGRPLTTPSPMVGVVHRALD